MINTVLTELAVKQAGVETGAETERERKSRVLEGNDQRDVHELGGDQGYDGDSARRRNILPRIKARRQHFDEDEPEEPRAVGHERLARHPDVALPELPVVKQGRDERQREQGQRDSRRRREDERQTQTPVEKIRILAFVRSGVILGQAWKQDRSERHAKQPGGEFHQPVRIVEPGNAAVLEIRGEYGVDKEADLADGYAEH